jgi:hypothetical protein
MLGFRCSHFEKYLHCDAIIAAAVYANIDGSTAFLRMMLKQKTLFLMMLGF